MSTKSSKKISISKTIRRQVEDIVQRFNEETFNEAGRGYVPRFRGRFLYLDRSDHGEPPLQICRLTYAGKMDDWEFAIYKHSRNRYDPDEWFFPGTEFLDGTVEGAMKAGIEAYPVRIIARNPLLALLGRLLPSGKS